MNSFPIINQTINTDCFNRICYLLDNQKIKLLEIAERATSHIHPQFRKNPDPATFERQIQTLKQRVTRIADGEGQYIITKLIEELYDEVIYRGIPGVNDNDVLAISELNLVDGTIRYTNLKIWEWRSVLNVNGNEKDIIVSINKSMTPKNSVIVPEYIQQYIQQSVNAFRQKSYATSLVLTSIALEGTLRDALIHKNLRYSRSANETDIYEYNKMHIYPATDGYLVRFPDSMPIDHSRYPGTLGSSLYKEIKIKRVIDRNGNASLFLKDINDIIDYWSSNNIVTPASVKITGLGAALTYMRNNNLINEIDLPIDLDKPIQAVRNNLIHLSGDSLDIEVAKDLYNNPIFLKDFLKNENRVLDTIWSISNTINILYMKIANNTI